MKREGRRDGKGEKEREGGKKGEEEKGIRK